jgi:hypothetical protein
MEKDSAQRQREAIVGFAKWEAFASVGGFDEEERAAYKHISEGQLTYTMMLQTRRDIKLLYFLAGILLKG